MTKKLEPNKSLDIIKKALKDFRPESELHPDEKLGALTTDQLDRFRLRVTELTREQKLEINSEALPVLPHLRLKDVAKALSEMAGDPYTTKPHHPPPVPPPSGGDKPKYPGPRKPKATVEATKEEEPL